MAIVLTAAVADQSFAFASFAAMPVDSANALRDLSPGDRTTYIAGSDTPGVASDPGVNCYALVDFGAARTLVSLAATLYTSGAGRLDFWWFTDLAAFQSAWTANHAGSGSPLGEFSGYFAQSGLPGGTQAQTWAEEGWRDVYVAPPVGTTARYALVRARADTGGVAVIVGRLSDFRAARATNPPAAPTLTAAPALSTGEPVILLGGA